MRMRMRVAILLASLGLASGACGSGRSDSEPPPTEPPRPAEPQPQPQPPPAPWAGERLAAADVPPVLLEAWRAAENRSSCAPLAPVSAGAAAGATPPVPAGATPRRATFSDGWGVAWDLPELRSAFGVAGTGAAAAAPSYNDWPHRLRWADGSTAGYGPEGGTGPNDLAYLRVAGQGCLYNVWSRLGIDHLERLLGALRLVDAAGG